MGGPAVTDRTVSVHRWLAAAARQPDGPIDGRALAESDEFRGVPDAVVEVWSPRNTLAEMNAKRREYYDAGTPVFVEAYISDLGDVRLDWQVPTDRRGIWQTSAAAAGDIPLVIDAPRPFRVIPNELRG